MATRVEPRVLLSIKGKDGRGVTPYGLMNPSLDTVKGNSGITIYGCIAGKTTEV